MDEFIAAMIIKYAIDHLQQGVALKTYQQTGSNVVCVEVYHPDRSAEPQQKFRITVEEVT